MLPVFDRLLRQGYSFGCTIIMRKPQSQSIDIEQTQETSQPTTVVSRAEMESVGRIAGELIQRLAGLPDGDQVGQIVDNALKLLRDKTNRGDIKLINRSLKELRYALKVFAPYRDVRKVSIFGSARTPEDSPAWRQAAAFARAMAQAGWMVITGAGGGIMAAGHGGAGAQPSFGLAIRLPSEQKTNRFIAHDPKLINFRYFFTRKLMFVRSCHAIALFPGGFGTMDEGFEVLTLVQTGKAVPMPIVMIDVPGGNFWAAWQNYVSQHLLANGLIDENDLCLYRITDDVSQAVSEICRFYSNYHSLRYTKDELVIRLHRAPGQRQLQRLRHEFADIVVDGDFRVSQALPVERDEPALKHLPRLVFAFNRKDFGRLRQLIDRLNEID